ncbi:OmpA family protein [Halomonas nitroreducens]|nr:OmpA family protein [Halomonas nitroreducens]
MRFQEKSTFPSGAARVLLPFAALLQDISRVLEDVPGIIEVDGHTDDVPISGSRYASNWDLSAVRASSVAKVLLSDSGLELQRLVVRGFADTRPLADNRSAEGRARNRRVEIAIDLGESDAPRGTIGFRELSVG